ncbi:hypothetical protein SAMN04487906_0661 [Zhouia amylolytica]|uniref:Sensor of ECF-type sigma factor n=2 Tax=Zhouia amylolytica TaxID=376730 RepID=W2UPV0_9FLAO|nr:hypothetical protein [Zhouia amylolytica]ETN95974.1 hypothetical protein P278_16960 [Zhouia amylolytica AD3]MCQ0111262.1 hypothetical protein [Zhouia amylolytica]SFS51922.1 hypothetical protein SAMN04487906_0661 [Zhouia amylolytica]
MKKLFTLFAICFFVSVLQAQESKHEKIKALKVAFITEKLALTTQEAESFWPIYNSYDETMHKLKYEEMGKIKKTLKETPLEDLSESKAKKMYQEWLSLENHMCSNRRNMLTKLEAVLPYSKIMMLQRAEWEFHRKLIDQLRSERRKGKERKE